MFKTTVSLGALLMLLGGCSSGAPTDEEVTGSAKFTLTMTGGHTALRLTSAEIEISGPESILLTAADGETAALAELLPGAYSSRLLDTWRLQSDASGAWQDVAARLEDDSEKPFSIAAGEVTEIFYRFTVDSNDPPPCLSCPSGSRDTAAIYRAASDRTVPVPPALKVPPVPTAGFDPPLPAPVP